MQFITYVGAKILTITVLFHLLPYWLLKLLKNPTGGKKKKGLDIYLYSSSIWIASSS